MQTAVAGYSQAGLLAQRAWLRSVLCQMHLQGREKPSAEAGSCLGQVPCVRRALSARGPVMGGTDPCSRRGYPGATRLRVQLVQQRPWPSSCSSLSCSCQVGNCVFLNSALPWPYPKINLHSFPPCIVLHKTKRPFLFVRHMNSVLHAAAGGRGRLRMVRVSGQAEDGESEQEG